MSEPPKTKPRSLAIGAGSRAQRALLPAIYCLADELELVGLCDRDAGCLAATARLWDCDATATHLDAFDWSRIDLVAITVPATDVPDVLQQLARVPTAKVTLLLDAPLLAGQGSLWGRASRNFAAVGVLQAAPTQPNFQAARVCVAAGKVGTPQKLWLQHNSCRESAIAIARTFAGGAAVRSARTVGFGQGLHEYALAFPNGFRASILEPCDYEMGRFALAGTDGLVVDYPLSAPDTIQIGCAFDGEFWRGITIDGDLQPLGPRDWEFCDRLPYARLPDDSLQALLEIRGLVEVLHAACVGDPTASYSWHDSLYDALLLDILDRTAVWYDPLASQSRSLLGLTANRVLPNIYRMLESQKKSPS